VVDDLRGGRAELDGAALDQLGTHGARELVELRVCAAPQDVFEVIRVRLARHLDRDPDRAKQHELGVAAFSEARRDASSATRMRFIRRSPSA
jgi:hypothetical protein